MGALVSGLVAVLLLFFFALYLKTRLTPWRIAHIAYKARALAAVPFACPACQSQRRSELIDAWLLARYGRTGTESRHRRCGLFKLCLLALTGSVSARARTGLVLLRASRFFTPPRLQAGKTTLAKLLCRYVRPLSAWPAP